VHERAQALESKTVKILRKKRLIQNSSHDLLATKEQIQRKEQNQAFEKYLEAGILHKKFTFS